MRPEASTRFDPVVVDDTQLTEPHMPRNEVVVERKAVSALQPFQLRRAAFKCRAYRDHLILPSPAPIVHSRMPGLPQTRQGCGTTRPRAIPRYAPLRRDLRQLAPEVAAPGLGEGLD